MPVGVAVAQKSDKDKKAQAKSYVDAGLAAEKAADYDTAIAMYAKAYAVIPHPVLLFNIANAHRLAGAMPQALDYYQQYLAVDPQGEQAKASKARIAEIEQAIADAKGKADADAKAKADADAKAKADADAKTRAKAEADAQAQADADARAQADADAKAQADAEARARRDAEPKTFTPMRIAGVAAGGLGVAGLAGGVVFGLKAKSISDELSEPGAQFDPARVDDGEAANTMMFVCYGVGAALVATGAVLWVIGKDTRVAPTADEHGAGLSLAGTF